MKITTAISIEVEGAEQETRERVIGLAQEEILRFSAALADRLEEAGIEDVEIDVQGDR